MKRFLVFAGENYYPRGGWDDFHSGHESQEEAFAVANQLLSRAASVRTDGIFDWSHVVDSATGKQIHQGRRGTAP